jgi:hypothetical protein
VSGLPNPAHRVPAKSTTVRLTLRARASGVRVIVTNIKEFVQRKPFG